jgi:hypothetical protein
METEQQYVVTFAREWERNANPTKGLRPMSLADANKLVTFAHPRCGVILPVEGGAK